MWVRYDLLTPQERWHVRRVGGTWSEDKQEHNGAGSGRSERERDYVNGRNVRRGNLCRVGSILSLSSNTRCCHPQSCLERWKTQQQLLPIWKWREDHTRSHTWLIWDICSVWTTQDTPRHVQDVQNIRFCVVVAQTLLLLLSIFLLLYILVYIIYFSISLYVQ